MISHPAALFFNTRPLRLTIFNPYRSNVEINTTLLTVVADAKSGSYRHTILECYILIVLKFLFSSGCFWTVETRYILEKWFVPECWRSEE